MNRKQIIYFDNCCNSRLFDDKTKPNIKPEADAIQRIINNKRRGGYLIIGSFAVDAEINRIPDNEKRRAAKQKYEESIDGWIKRTVQIMARARKLEAYGLRKMDAAHLAAAEAADTDYLLTVDNGFLKVCSRQNFTKVKVINPIDFERR
jgi:predicted nucleic acid-binding protein